MTIETVLSSVAIAIGAAAVLFNRQISEWSQHWTLTIRELDYNVWLYRVLFYLIGALQIFFGVRYLLQ